MRWRPSDENRAWRTARLQGFKAAMTGRHALVPEKYDHNDHTFLYPLNAPADETPYKPERDLVVRFALALQLSIADADDLLTVAGYAHLRKPPLVPPTSVAEDA